MFLSSINIVYVLILIFLIFMSGFIAWKFSKSKKITGTTVVSLLSISVLGFIALSDSLVSDEKMIENFKSNRAASRAGCFVLQGWPKSYHLARYAAGD